MTDINNMGADKLNNLSNVNFEGVKNFQGATSKNYTEKEIKNLDNAHSALVGRSMIKKTSKVQPAQEVHFDEKTIENIKGDLAELEANPALIKKAIAIGEAAVKKGYTYQQAAAMSREFVDAYSSKLP